jgi:hypothetical protein
MKKVILLMLLALCSINFLAITWIFFQVKQLKSTKVVYSINPTELKIK